MVGKRLVVLKDFELRKKILDEAHDSLLSIHPGSSKMCQDLKQKFWWTRMKRYIAECDVCTKSEGRPSQAGQNSSTIAYSFMEIGGHRNGFYHRPTQDFSR